jgi:tetratricopeptide (TPR) repeat protein
MNQKFDFMKLASILCMVCLAVNFSFALNPADMPLRQVISEAQAMIANNDFAGASPYLDELELRFEDEKDPAVAKILQQFGFVRGIGYLQSFGKTGNKNFLEKAAKAFGFFAEKFPEDSKAVMALQRRTDCLRALHQWEKAAVVIETLLDPAKPYKKQILKRSELLSLYFGRAQCYHIKQNWPKGEPAFRELLKYADLAKDEDRAAYAVSCLTEMFVEKKRIDEIFPFLPRLSMDTPARYDLRLNINLMKGAADLTAKERHVEASLFFSLTMTTEEIIVYYTDREKRLQAERAQLDQFLALKKSVLPRRRLAILKDKSNDLAMKLTNAKGQLEMAQKTPSFTTTLRWKKADNFQSTKRDWESFWSFYWLYKDFPKHKEVENFIYAAFASANTVKHREKSIELGEEYLKNTKWMTYRPDVTFIMANAYRLEAETQRKIAVSLRDAISTSERDMAKKASEKSKNYYDRFFDLCDRYLELAHADGSTEKDRKYARDFVNLMGTVYFETKRLGDLLEKFAGFKDGVMNPAKGYANRPEFRKSPAMPSVHYMSGLALTMIGRFEEAKPLLGAVLGVNVKGLPLDDPNQVQDEEPEPEDQSLKGEGNETK